MWGNCCTRDLTILVPIKFLSVVETVHIICVCTGAVSAYSEQVHQSKPGIKERPYWKPGEKARCENAHKKSSQTWLFHLFELWSKHWHLCICGPYRWTVVTWQRRPGEQLNWRRNWKSCLEDFSPERWVSWSSTANSGNRYWTHFHRTDRLCCYRL